MDINKTDDDIAHHKLLFGIGVAFLILVLGAMIT